MAEIDLIPNDYRMWLGKQTMLKRFASVVVAINAFVLLGVGWVHYLAGHAQADVSDLKSKNSITEQQQAQLHELKAQQTEYERQLSVLYGLRAGAAVDEIFSIVDRSLVAGELWFLDWSFRRAGVVVNGEQSTVQTGYFIIVTEEGRPEADQELQVETHMTINGQAQNHQSLSKFVRALFEQPEIKDVNVQKTSLAQYADSRVVDFKLTVVLNSAVRES